MINRGIGEIKHSTFYSEQVMVIYTNTSLENKEVEPFESVHMNIYQTPE